MERLEVSNERQSTFGPLALIREPFLADIIGQNLSFRCLSCVCLCVRACVSFSMYVSGFRLPVRLPVRLPIFPSINLLFSVNLFLCQLLSVLLPVAVDVSLSCCCPSYIAFSDGPSLCSVLALLVLYGVVEGVRWVAYGWCGMAIEFHYLDAADIFSAAPMEGAIAAIPLSMPADDFYVNMLLDRIFYAHIFM